MLITQSLACFISKRRFNYIDLGLFLTFPHLLQGGGWLIAIGFLIVGLIFSKLIEERAYRYA